MKKIDWDYLKFISLVYGSAILSIIVIAFLGYSHVHSKLELCRIYYKEMSTFSCYMSDHLPGVPRK